MFSKHLWIFIYSLQNLVLFFQFFNLPRLDCKIADKNKKMFSNKSEKLIEIQIQFIKLYFGADRITHLKAERIQMVTNHILFT